MSDELTPQEIKDIRKKYGLSQQAFARVLGIGDVSIVRYENGAKPTRAMANLIRAAKNESFMLECLQRDGDRIPQPQKDQAEKIIYSVVDFNEEGEVMNINQIYTITLTREILNEQAAEMVAKLSRMQRSAKQDGDDNLAALYKAIRQDILRLKRKIITPEYEDELKLAQLQGAVQGLMDLALGLEARAA